MARTKKKQSTRKPKVTVQFKQGIANEATRQAMGAVEFLVQSFIKTAGHKEKGLVFKYDFNVIFDDRPRGSKQALPSALVPTKVGGDRVVNIHLDNSHPWYIEARKALKKGNLTELQSVRIFASIAAQMIISTIAPKERYMANGLVSKVSNTELEKVGIKISRSSTGKRAVQMTLKGFTIDQDEKDAVRTILELPMAATLTGATIPKEVRSSVKVICHADCPTMGGVSLSTKRVTIYDTSKGDPRSPDTWVIKDESHPNLHILQTGIPACRVCLKEDRSGQWQLLDPKYYDPAIAKPSTVLKEATEIITATS